jgi:hypothetical protein
MTALLSARRLPGHATLPPGRTRRSERLAKIGDEMLDIFLAAGVDRPGDLVSFGRAIRDGWFAVPTGDVESLTGRPGRTMRELLEASLA